MRWNTAGWNSQCWKGSERRSKQGSMHPELNPENDDDEEEDA
ncbi:MAG: hypothetical protein V8T36_12740 [Ruthenibacterium lactatiformans]